VADKPAFQRRFSVAVLSALSDLRRIASGDTGLFAAVIEQLMAARIWRAMFYRFRIIGHGNLFATWAEILFEASILAGAVMRALAVANVLSKINRAAAHENKQSH
jgi:hypothetical protein